MDLIIYNTSLLLWLATILYCCAFASALNQLLRTQSFSKPSFYTLLSSAFIIQGLALYYRGILIGAVPLTTTLEILQVISWSTIFLIIIFQIAFKLPLLTFFGTGLISFINLISLIFFKFNNDLPNTKISINPWIEFHIGLAIFAYALFGLLAITSLMYLLQDYALSKKHFGTFYNLLPSLKQISELSLRILLIGIISFGLAIIIGTLTLFENANTISLGKTLSTWGLLICYLTLYLLKYTKHLKFRTFSWVSLFLFIMAIISLWPVQQ